MVSLALRVEAAQQIHLPALRALPRLARLLGTGPKHNGSQPACAHIAPERRYLLHMTS